MHLKLSFYTSFCYCRCMTNEQKNNLFESANASILIASDYAGFLESAKSFVIDAMKEEGVPEEEAVVYFTAMGEKETGAAEAYLHCFTELDIEPEFDAWAEQDKNFEASRKEILELIHETLSQSQTLQ